tara:strand:+ start:916 stop:1509 length:594 start_codon:yes stop_codon:yes gene_type:complete
MIWLFGETSDFSKSLLNELKKKNDDIETFGRRNISYIENARSEINLNETLPDKVIVNINLNPQLSLMKGDKWVKPLQVIYFISDLLQAFYESGKDITVVYITSSIAVNRSPEQYFLKHKDYISIRQTQQAMWSSYDLNKLKVLGVSPSNIDDKNMQKYSERIVGFLYDTPPVRKSLIDLSWHNGTKDEWVELYKVDK